MADNVNRSLTSILKEEFDEKYEVITKNGREVPFSVDIILKDLLDTGLNPMESLKILEDIGPHLERGIENRRIIQLINQSLQQNDIGRSFIKSNYLQPITVIYSDESDEVFNYKTIKRIIRKRLKPYEYTSKTFKAFAEELYRIVLSLRTDRLKIDVLESMIPSVLRNVIGLNPFSKSSLEEDYNNIIKLSDSIFKTWDFLPNSEKVMLITSMFESFYKILLLNFNFLPGYNLKSTITQVNQLIAELTENPTSLLSDKEIYLIGKSSRIISELLQKHDFGSELENEAYILEFVENLQEISTKFVNPGMINWLIIIDQNGNEIFSKFSYKKDLKYQSLLGMAISGVQSLVNELTDTEIRKIDHEDGSILIERDELFSVIAMVDMSTPTIHQNLKKLATFLKTDLRQKLENFKGKVSVFDEVIDNFINENFSQLFYNK